MAVVTLQLERVQVPLAVREVEGKERLGEPSTFDVTCFAQEPIEGTALLGQRARLRVESDGGEQVFYGVVMRVVARGTAQGASGRIYRLTMSSALARLELRRRTRVFQHLSVPDIVQRIVREAGYEAGACRVTLHEQHSPRTYVVQYFETDLSFVRRLCEDEGLYFRFSSSDDGEVFVLEDTSTAAPTALDETLMLADYSGLLPMGRGAFLARSVRARAPGKVTIRDYDPLRPALQLNAVATGGERDEQDVEVYAAPGGFGDAASGAKRASIHLESLRAEADVCSLRTNTLSLRPGTSFRMECAPDYSGTARVDGELVAIGVRHAWSVEHERYVVDVDAIRRATPYRLPRVTPKPRIHGVQSAYVTGAPGQEIHPDEHGRVFLHFLWDREGPTDHRSSLPVRVAQPNMPGSMLLPRVGWEVAVAFEDGDPERPYVLGRLYNGRQPPPMPLPANKTVTSFATYSSPGGRARNSIHFDDAAGRQHVAIHAGLAMSTAVGNDRVTQVAKVEEHTVGGSQTFSVGGAETVSVKQAYVVTTASQAASVGGDQHVFVKGDQGINVGSETVAVGSALVEAVGSVATGAVNLAHVAALAGAAAMGRAGEVVAAAGVMGAAAAHGAESGNGAARGAAMGLLGIVAGQVPGGDAVLASVSGAARPPPWSEPPDGNAAPLAGGGAAAAISDAGAARGPGAGHRNTQVTGALLEAIGGAHGMTTPGSIAWSTTGSSTMVIAGSHSTRAASVSSKILGGSSETVGALRIKSGSTVSRDVAGALTLQVGGDLNATAGGKYVIASKSALTLNVGGSLTLEGAYVTFICGGSVVAASPGGVLIKADNITITGASKQSGKATHS